VQLLLISSIRKTIRVEFTLIPLYQKSAEHSNLAGSCIMLHH